MHRSVRSIHFGELILSLTRKTNLNLPKAIIIWNAKVKSDELALHEITLGRAFYDESEQSYDVKVENEAQEAASSYTSQSESDHNESCHGEAADHGSEQPCADRTVKELQEKGNNFNCCEKYEDNTLFDQHFASLSATSKVTTTTLLSFWVKNYIATLVFEIWLYYFFFERPSCSLCNALSPLMPLFSNYSTSYAGLSLVTLKVVRSVCSGLFHS